MSELGKFLEVFEHIEQKSLSFENEKNCLGGGWNSASQRDERAVFIKILNYKTKLFSKFLHNVL